MSFAEASLICAYRTAAKAAEKTSIIRRYAELTRLSLGRAEDALDLFSDVLTRRGF